MYFKEPENNNRFYWTRHIKEKMKYYGIGEGRLRRILRVPQRREEGIVPNTVALMQSAGTKRPSEIWLMYQQVGQKKKMISAWRYPGISPIGEPIPIPEDIIEELRKNKEIL